MCISRRCYDFLDLLLQEWQTHSLERWELFLSGLDQWKLRHNLDRFFGICNPVKKSVRHQICVSAGIHLFWWRASRKESEMQIQKPEWKLASKMLTISFYCLQITCFHPRFSWLLVAFFRAYWGLRNHFPAEADALYNSLESSYQRTLQSCLKSSGSVASLPQSDRSSSSSQESLK